MRGKRIWLGVAVAGLLALGGLLGGILRDAPSERLAAPAAPGLAADQALNGFSLGDTEGTILELQQVVRENPESADALSSLGLAYQQRARETGDPYYYTKAEGVLRQALELRPGDLTATSGLGSLALARHEFAEALELGERARDLSPTTARNYAVIGDALVELGRYEEAFAAFDRMADLKPGIASYARVSYARELLGDGPGAIEAMELAVDAARGAAEPMAWTLVQLGKLHWQRGGLDEAESNYRRALDVYPDYVYALDGLAQVEGARGNFAEAVELEERAVALSPLPQFVTQLGDLYRVSGQEELAREQYELMDAIQTLLDSNGVRTELETAVYYADHGIRLDRALELARVAQAERPSIYGDDALAWALERNGRCEEARTYSERSLRLDTADPVLFFHRGMIERCLGNAGEAAAWFRRALALNPDFSLLWAPVAREALP